jgi:hypothetical protein
MAILIWMASPSVKGYVKEDTSHPIMEYSARYSVNWHGLYAGESIHVLKKRPNGQYFFEAKTEPRLRFLPFHYTESSDFTWQSGQFIPQHYHYNIQEGKRRKKGNVNFEWKTHQLENRESPDHWKEAFSDGVQDKVTQALSLRYALKTGQNVVNYTVAEEDKFKVYTFKILGQEQLQTKLGTIETVKVEHISRKGHRTITWFAKKWDYLPVKMNQFRQGKLVASGEILTFTPTQS